jgi:hypothetical protein
MTPESTEATENPLAEFMPTDPLMRIAWVDFIRFAIGNDDFIAAYCKATGAKFNPPKSAIDAMIDDACGINNQFVIGFVKWVTETHWGPLDIVAGEDCES